MHISWQISEEWWGRRAVAHVGGRSPSHLTININEMDSQTIWTIHDDVYLLYRGEASGLEQAQKDAGAKVRRILLSKNIKGWWQVGQETCSAR